MTPAWLVPLLASFAVVALAEMGDKTQLIALSLAARYRRPWMVMLGILIATLLNHALASSVGVWIGARLLPAVLGWLLGLGFIAFGVWTLFPDAPEAPGARERWGPLLSTIVVFFLAEMGDKTQLATVALGARFFSPVPVTLGTTLGMLAADSLAVFAGTHLAATTWMPTARRSAAILFFLFGLAAIAHTIGLS